jgi:excisionase family DNA binding protein|tara:strand:+ start:536 stop:784 length:249 start_codon:yes stop_codon:yes gene_type:complete
MSESFVPIEDIAKHFSVSISTVRAWVRQKHIPEDTYIKIGSTYRFRVSDVESALTSSKKEVRSQEIEYLNDLPVSDFLDEDQ